ncbi:putative DNA polymerase III, epsilon subunit [Candidatus Zinderia insecticola CARI]|uniref:DNA polymerase III subunit epsilon n=1 Tax=Zinderia insecticola (strain CARI) TaxID=871271 RepID=E0TIR8_ZINIC|nr:putative DNA polymerase III, epsilon subunit [Candidatus Zinderia insecticola CARI]
MKKEIILDIETTGLNVKKGDRIIEIACIKILNRKITNKKFHEYINPNRKSNKDALKIHGISDKFLKNKPFFKDIIDKLINFIKNYTIIIHNSSFDISFLNKEFKILKYKKFKYYVKNIVDSLKIARKKFPNKKNDLNSLCKRFKISIKKRKLHNALLDCILLSKIYLILIRKQKNIFYNIINKEKKINNKNKKKLVNKMINIKINKDENKIHKDIIKNINLK